MTQRAAPAAQLLLINPNTSEATTALMAQLARQRLPARVELLTATAQEGAPLITDEASLAIAVRQVVRMGEGFAQQRAAAQQPLPAVIVIGAFGNPGLAQLRARLSHMSLPVLGLGAAALRAGAKGGRRFGIATITPGLEASIAQSVAELGLTAQFCGTRIPPGLPQALAADPALLRERLAQAVAQCISVDGAQAVVIGGGPLAQAAGELAPRFAQPVISAVDAAVDEALGLLGLQGDCLDY
ncbi:MAG: aspartate/glutamate racemase family protein [Comamonas sp.]|uniref:aspartate/glutamate racemase family protein n=2 Tax=Comamonas sp. TaxID=34028 RepID=UPI002FCBC56C